jgi:hypothetical protein
VDRISRFLDMSAIFDYNSAQETALAEPLACHKNNAYSDLQIASVTNAAITAVTFLRLANTRSV